VVEQEHVNISIIIPAKNEAKNIVPCLEAIFSQDVAVTGNVEVIVMDSGSTDDTVERVRRFPQVTLLQIPPDQFGHGKTRNLGAEHAKGEFLVFLNADAIPANPSWLSHLIEPLKTHSDIAGVFSRHLPKPGCYLYMVRDLLGSTPPSPTLRIRENLHALDFMIFSTVSCGIRGEIWQRFPFKDDILIAEDQDWGARVLQKGFKIAYQAASMVYHSHNYSAQELYEIKFKVGLSTSRFKSKTAARFLGFVLVTGGMLVKWLGDMTFIFFKSPGPVKLSLSQKCKELSIAWKARVASFKGRYAGWLRKEYR